MREQGQSRTASLVESVVNIGTGFIVALWLTKVLFVNLSLYDNVRVTTIFTVVSLVRGFVIRRAFNWITLQ